jgi:NADPH-dependent glutamate synthase beta subunit-like oxidoreductase
LDARGNVAANEQDWQTSLPGVFVAGDARRGQSLVVWAIAEAAKPPLPWTNTCACDPVKAVC